MFEGNWLKPKHKNTGVHIVRTFNSIQFNLFNYVKTQYITTHAKSSIQLKEENLSIWTTSCEMNLLQLVLQGTGKPKNLVLNNNDGTISSSSLQSHNCQDDRQYPIMY